MEDKQKRPIRLLTYNLFMRPPGIKTNADDYKNQRFFKLKEYILDYDIICFQELFSAGNFRKQALIEFGIINNFNYWAFSQSPSFFSGPVIDGGLAIISKYPIVNYRFESYNLGILSDSASDKGSLYCKILANNQTIHIFNTHLQATYHNADDLMPIKLSIVTRLTQFQILASRIQKTLDKEHYQKEDMVLIAGDLNTDARKTYYNLNFSEAKNFSQRHNLNSDQFNEYDVMKEILRNKDKNTIIDFAFEKYLGHPITFGDGQTILTGPHDTNSKQRLDYIIQIKPNNNQSRLKAEISSCLIQKFKVQSETFTQLSDHYGISINLY